MSVHHDQGTHHSPEGALRRPQLGLPQRGEEEEEVEGLPHHLQMEGEAEAEEVAGRYLAQWKLVQEGGHF